MSLIYNGILSTLTMYFTVYTLDLHIPPEYFDSSVYILAFTLSHLFVLVNHTTLLPYYFRIQISA